MDLVVTFGLVLVLVAQRANQVPDGAVTAAIGSAVHVSSVGGAIHVISVSLPPGAGSGLRRLRRHRHRRTRSCTSLLLTVPASVSILSTEAGPTRARRDGVHTVQRSRRTAVPAGGPRECPRTRWLRTVAPGTDP